MHPSPSPTLFDKNRASSLKSLPSFCCTWPLWRRPPRARLSSAQMTHAHPSGWHRERYDRLRVPPSGDAHSLADVVRGLGATSPAPNFCIRHGAAAGGGGDEWPRRGNGHHRRAVSRGRRRIPDPIRCLGRPTDPTVTCARLSRPNPTSLQPFVPAHRTAACDDRLNHGPVMHARPERGLRG